MFPSGVSAREESTSGLSAWENSFAVVVDWGPQAGEAACPALWLSSHPSSFLLQGQQEQLSAWSRPQPSVKAGLSRVLSLWSISKSVCSGLDTCKTPFAVPWNKFQSDASSFLLFLWWEGKSQALPSVKSGDYTRVWLVGSHSVVCPPPAPIVVEIV